MTTSPVVAEMVGTLLLTLLGDGVVANVLLKGIKGQNTRGVISRLADV